MKFSVLIENAKKICGDRRVYSKDNTAFLIDGIIGFGDRHNVWFKDSEKKIHIIARNVSYENMNLIISGLFAGGNIMVNKQMQQLDLFGNSGVMNIKKVDNRIPKVESEEEYGNYTFEEWSKWQEEIDVALGV